MEADYLGDRAETHASEVGFANSLVAVLDQPRLFVSDTYESRCCHTQVRLVGAHGASGAYRRAA
jgi:hypothetical protein